MIEGENICLIFPSYMIKDISLGIKMSCTKCLKHNLWAPKSVINHLGNKIDEYLCIDCFDKDDNDIKYKDFASAVGASEEETIKILDTARSSMQKIEKLKKENMRNIPESIQDLIIRKMIMDKDYK